MAEAPMTAENLPEIDLLLISHDHYDHLDYETIKDIAEKVKNYCVPLGVENHLERWGVEPEKIRTMAWWEDIEINGFTISSTPGQHYSGSLKSGRGCVNEMAEDSDVAVSTPRIGETVNFSEINNYQEKWWREVE